MGEDPEGREPRDGRGIPDGITFDEDFVRGAALTEASHADRERVARREHGRHRRLLRRRRIRHTLWRRARLMLAVAIVAVVVGLGSRGIGPAGRLDAIRRLGGLDPIETADGGGSGASAGDAAVDGSETTTTIEQTLFEFDNRPGVCVRWDQAPDAGDHLRTEVVDCADEHVFEVAEAFDIDGHGFADGGPTDEEWNRILIKECEPRVTSYLGESLDPYGRFSTTAVKPTSQGWRLGDRRVTCGIEARPADVAGIEAEVAASFTGRVADADPAFSFPTGACLESVSELGGGRPVRCEDLHVVEVVGTADVSHLGDAYPGMAVIGPAVLGTCREAAEAVYGGPLPEGVSAGWLPILESSWDTGRRTLECTLGEGDGATWTMLEGPLRATPA